MQCASVHNTTPQSQRMLLYKCMRILTSDTSCARNLAIAFNYIPAVTKIIAVSPNPSTLCETSFETCMLFDNYVIIIRYGNYLEVKTEQTKQDIQITTAECILIDKMSKMKALKINKDCSVDGTDIYLDLR